MTRVRLREPGRLRVFVLAALALLGVVVAIGGAKAAMGADGDDSDDPTLPSSAVTTCFVNSGLNNAWTKYRLTLTSVEPLPASRSAWHYNLQVYSGSTQAVCESAVTPISSLNTARKTLESLQLNICGEDMASRIAFDQTSPQTGEPVGEVNGLTGLMWNSTSALFGSNAIGIVLKGTYTLRENRSIGQFNFGTTHLQVRIAGPDCSPAPPAPRTIRIVSVAEGGGLGSELSGTMSPFLDGVWSVAADGSTDITDVPAVQQTIVANPPGEGWTIGGYSVQSGLLNDCSTASYVTSGSGAAVPAVGEQTVCIKAVYTPPPRTITVTKVLGAAATVDTVFRGTISGGGPDTDFAIKVLAGSDHASQAYSVSSAAVYEVKEGTAANWTLNGYKLLTGAGADCIADASGYALDSGNVVPGDGSSYTVCIKNTYSPPPPVSVSLATLHIYEGAIGGDVPAGAFFAWRIAATVMDGPTLEPIVLSETLPEGMALTGSNSKPPDVMECAVDYSSPARVTCTIAAGVASGEYRFTVGVRAPGAIPASNCKDYRNTLTGTYGTEALAPASDTVRVAGCAAPAMSISMADSVEHAVNAGSGFDWRVTVTVAGGATSQDYTITDAVPAGFAIGALSTIGGTGAGQFTCAEPVANVVACTLRSGAEPGTHILTIPVVAPAAGTPNACGAYTNTAVLQTPGTADVEASDLVVVGHCTHKLTVLARLADGTAGEQMIEGVINGTGLFGPLAVSTSTDVHAQVFDVGASASHDVAQTSVPDGYALDGYLVIPGADAGGCFPPAGLPSGLAEMASVPGDGDYVVCIVNHLIPDISIAKGNDAGDGVAPGGTFHWTLTTTVAHGPTRTAVIVRDVLPAGFSLTPGSAVVSGGTGALDRASCTATPDTAECTLAAASPSGTYVFRLNVTASDDLGFCGEHLNTATIADVAGGGLADGASEQTHSTGSASDAVRINCGGLVIRAVNRGGDPAETFRARVDGQPAEVAFGEHTPSVLQVLGVGTRTVSEAPHPGYVFEGSAIGAEGSCPDGPTSREMVAPIAIDDGMTTYLCFYNQAVGTIVITKMDQTTGASGVRPEEWHFSLTGPNGFSRDGAVQLGGGTIVFEDVPLGNGFAATETEAHYGACPAPNPDGAYRTSVAGGAGTQDLTSAGQTITFTFVNQDCGIVLSTGGLLINSLADLNGNGVKDAGEPGNDHAKITVEGPEFPGGTEVLTNASGQIVLPGIATGVYSVTQEVRDGHRPIGLISTIATVSYGSETAVTFYSQPLLSIRVMKVEFTNEGRRAGDGWKITLTGCGMEPETKATDSTGVAHFADVPLCPDYTVSEDISSKPGFTAMGATTRRVEGTSAGVIHEVVFESSNVTVCTTCAGVQETPAPPATTATAAPSSAPEQATTPTPPGVGANTPTPGPMATPTGAGAQPGMMETPQSGSPAPMDIVEGVKIPGAAKTPIAPGAGSGIFRTSVDFAALLGLFGVLSLCTGIGVLCVARAGRSSRS